METPKEKALILVEKFYQNAPETFGTGRAQTYGIECAKIAVEEIINNGGTIFVIEYPKNTFKNGNDYWEEVLDELNKL